MAKGKDSAVAGYIIIALILGVITYVEFAIVEYPQEWLGRNWTMFWLIALSVVKFLMVVMYFMHLKGDDSTYTGFFSSGMFITMATFIGLTAMFILPRSVAATKPDNVQAGHATHDVPPDVMELVESDGFSRTPAARADSPRPADRSVRIAPPLAGNDASTYELNLPEPLTATDSDATTADGGTLRKPRTRRRARIPLLRIPPPTPRTQPETPRQLTPQPRRRPKGRPRTPRA